MLSEQALLDTVKASPAAVAAHDKQAWLDLFTHDAEVNDPIGSRAHAGGYAIERFYETFIAPNKIRFEVQQDVVCGHTVVRDVSIVTVMPTGLTVSVPTHIRYEMAESPQGPKIRRLYAHWELAPMVWQTLRTGLLGLRTYMRLSWRMIRCQGLAGVLGFMRGFAGVGRRGKRRAESFLQALTQTEAPEGRDLLASGAALELPAGSSVSLSELAQRTQGISWTKVIAAGRHVSASIVLHGQRGVLFLDFDSSRRISRGVFYLDGDKA